MILQIMLSFCHHLQNSTTWFNIYCEFIYSNLPICFIFFFPLMHLPFHWPHSYFFNINNMIKQSPLCWNTSTSSLFLVITSSTSPSPRYCSSNLSFWFHKFAFHSQNQILSQCCSIDQCPPCCPLAWVYVLQFCTPLKKSQVSSSYSWNNNVELPCVFAHLEIAFLFQTLPSWLLYPFHCATIPLAKVRLISMLVMIFF